MAALEEATCEEKERKELNKLEKAIREGNALQLSFLLKLFTGNDFNINSPLEKGNTLLHIAAITGNVECVRILLKNGADPKIRNDGGFKPIDLARTIEHQEVVNEIETHKITIMLKSLGFFSKFEELERRVKELEGQVIELKLNSSGPT